MSERTNLKISFQEKDAVKTWAKSDKIKISWDKILDTWFWIHTPGEKPPIWLETYIPKERHIHVLNPGYSYYPTAAKEGAKWNADYKVITYTGNPLPNAFLELKSKPGDHSYQELIAQTINREETRRDEGRKENPSASNIYESLSKNKGIVFEKPSEKEIQTILEALLLPLFYQKNTVILPETQEESEKWKRILKSNRLPISIVTYQELEALNNLTSRVNPKKNNYLQIPPEFQICILAGDNLIKSPKSKETRIYREIQKKIEFNVWITKKLEEDILKLEYLSNFFEKLNPKHQKNFMEWCKKSGYKIQTGSYGKASWIPNQEDIQKTRKFLSSCSNLR